MKIYLDKRIIFMSLFIFVIVTGLVGYSYLNSDLSSSLALRLSNRVCNQENLYERLSCMATPDNIKSKYVSSKTGIDFSNPSSDTNGKGIYTLSSSMGDTYPVNYFRGDISNNNVNFGGYCWKIIRTTELGGIRLIYNGVYNNSTNSCDGTNPNIGTSAFNTDDDSISYAGYTYNLVDEIHQNEIVEGYLYASSYTYSGGTFTLVNPTTDVSTVSTNHYTCRNSTGTCSEISFITFASDSTIYNVRFTNQKSIETFISESKGGNTSSTIKETIDNWFIDSSMSYSLVFFDESVYSGSRAMNTYGNDTSYTTNGWMSTNANTSNHLYYSTYGRLYFSHSPEFISNDRLDNYTVYDTTNGNGFLTNPIALLSGDDLMLAGSTVNEASNNYLNSGEDYWTMSPRTFNRADVRMFYLEANGEISSKVVSEALAVRPAITLSNKVIISSGTGTMDSPYRLELNGQAKLIGSTSLNAKMKQLANNDSDYNWNDYDYNIEQVEVFNYLDKEHIDPNYLVSTEDSIAPIYMWYNSSNYSIYFYSNSPVIYLPEDSSYTFYNFHSLTNVDFFHIDTSQVVDMSYMFANCFSLLDFDLGNLHTSSVKSMDYMFAGEDDTEEYMQISSFGNYDYLNTEQLESMNGMFMNNSSITELDLSTWDLSKVTYMAETFKGCTALETVSIGSSVMSELGIIDGMFQDCTSLTSVDLTYLNTTFVNTMDNLFNNCTSLSEIYVSQFFYTSHLDSSENMFYNCTSLVGGAGTVFDPNHIDKEYAHIDGGSSNPGYFRG